MRSVKTKNKELTYILETVNITSMVSEDSWENYFREMETEWKIRDFLINFIEDLKMHDMIESRRTKQEIEAINAMLINANNVTEAVSGVAHELGLRNLSPEQFDRIPIKSWKYALLIMIISQYNIQVENFRNLMLYLLKKKGKINYNTTLGTLMREIKKVSKIYGNKLDRRIAVEFRNAFAHSRYWITEHEIRYVVANDFSKCKVIRQTGFIAHVRYQNILTKCLGDIINEYYLPDVGT